MVKIDFYTKSIRGKIIAIFIIAALSIGLSWIILRVAFGQVVNTIEEISKPNNKLQLLNNLSSDISQIGQYQRKLILQHPTKDYPILLPESKEFIKRLDTLRTICVDNKLQLLQIDSVENIVNQYDALVVDYLKLYTSLFNNEPLTGKFKSLSDLIYANAAKMDSSIITSDRSGITTTTQSVPPRAPKVKQKTSFIKRFLGIFGSEERSKETLIEQTIKNERSIRVDTVVVSQRGSLKKAIDESVQNIDKYHRLRSVTLANRELDLIHDANGYISRIRRLLREMEEAEIVKMKANDGVLVNTVQTSMTRITIIMILFIIVTIILIYFVFSDIARNNQYRKQLLEAKEEAEYLTSVKQRFLSNMSHEIRTPLQSIIGFSEQIMTEERPSKASIEAIHFSSEHLLQIVNEVLDYSRIVSGKFTFDNKAFNMNALLTEVAATMKLQATKKNIQFNYKNEEPYPLLYIGDAFRLKQILYNLIGNAIKFTNDGSVTLEVESTLKYKSTKFLFRIIDTGIGISEADLKRIFNEFEQADTNEYQPKNGTGLGLNISKALVEEQDGTFTAKSALDEGSSFVVTLTYENAEEALPADPEKPLTNKLNFTGKVLIIDDDPFILQLCSNIFNKYGIRYTAQISPEKLLSEEWDNDISLIFTDIRMPGMSGIELCKLLRGRISKEVHIIALTAHALQNEQKAILDQGFDGLITKPFKEDDIIACLNKNSRVVNRLNINALLAMCMQDPELLRLSLVSFFAETTQDLTLLWQLIDEQNQSEMMEICHKLAGRIAQVGYMSLSFKLRKIETSLKHTCDLEKITDELKGIMKEIEELIEAVKLEIDTRR